VKSLLIVVAFAMTCYLMGAWHNNLLLIVALPLGVLSGIVASKADELDAMGKRR
jgi:uncharacterized membrane protein